MLACRGAAYGGDTKTKSLRNACFAVVAGCCFLLPSGAATADAQPPPSPEELSVEERLKKALSGLHRMTAQLEELVGTPTGAQTDGESLVDALKPYGQRDGELQPLLEER